MKTAQGCVQVGLFSKGEESVLEDAASLIEKARGAKPEKAEAAWAKAHEFLEKHATRVEKDKSALADRYVSLGGGLMGIKDRTGALASWNRALDVYGKHLGAFLALAKAFEDADNAGEARRYHDKAIEANPGEPRALEAKATFLLRKHDNAPAGEIFRKLHDIQPEEMRWVAELTELEPENGKWWLARAKIAHRLKQRDDAMAWTLKAAKLSPQDPLPHVYESLLLEERGDKKEALKAAEEAVVLGPSHKEANLQRARILTALGQEDAALEAWLKFTRIAPEEARGWVDAAALLAKKGKLEEASIHYDHGCDLQPADPKLWSANAEVKVRLGKFAEALAAFDGAQKAGANDAAHFKGKAAAQLKLARFDAAFESAGLAARASPEDGQAYELALDSLDGIEPRRPDDYLKVADLLLRCAPASERASVEKTRSLTALGKWAESAAAATWGLVKNPKSIELWRLKAAAHKARGQREAVADACAEVLALDPKDKAAGLDRGEALFDLGRYQEALEAYNALLMLDPAHSFAASRRGQCLQRLSRHREAIDAFDKVLARDKENVLAHRFKAESLAALGKRSDAISEMDVAIGFDPKNVKLWLYKASLHQQGGESDAAKRCFAKAIEVDPKNAEALTARASLNLSKGHAQDALLDLDALTRGHPSGGEGWLLFAEALEAVGRIEDARNAIQHAIVLNTKDVNALRQAGGLEMRAGAPAQGASFFARAVDLDPTEPATRVQLGEAHEASGEAEKAHDAYAKARELLPDDREVAGLLKNALRLLHRDGDLEALCLELIGKNLKDTDALFDLAVARRNLGKMEAALEALDKLLKLEPNDVNALNDRGYVLSLMGKHKEALPFYSRAIELNPKAEHALVNKGLALHKLGEQREALACFRAACDLNPKEASNWNLLGLCYSALDMHTKALEAYDEGLKLVPTDGMLLNNKGKALADTSDNVAAVAAFEAAAAANPKDANAHLNHGICLYRLGRIDDAAAALERAMVLRPTSPEVLYNLGRIRMEKREFTGALECFDAMVKASAQDAGAWENRGICLDNLDRFEEAVVSYDRSLGIDAQNPRTWKNKGVAYRSLKRYDEALPCFERAHKLDPRDERALELRNECAEIIKEREIEKFARKVLDFEFAHGRKPSREEAFKTAGVPIQHLDDALTYLASEPKLDLMGISREELLDLEKASAAVLKFIVSPEAAARGDPIKVTLAELLNAFPETSVRRAKKILKYMAEVDRVTIDPKRTVTPDLEKAVSQAVEIPPDRRNLREVSVRLNAGILRSKRVLQVLTSLERELEIPAHEVTIHSIKDAGWKMAQAADDLEAETEAGRKKRRVREEEPEFVFDVKGAQPVHAAPTLARQMAQYAGGTAPDGTTGPAAPRPRVYCSSCKIRGASHRHNECGEFLCDVCLERFNQVEHVSAGIKLLCPVCEQPIRDLGEAIPKWDKM